MPNKQLTIGEYLLKKLKSYEINHIFGIPGDYVVQFFDMIEQSPIQQIGTTREETAGFAADAYARTNGMGAACVTYGVGGLSMINAVTAAYAEKSPLVVISGSPGINERTEGALLHHKGKDFFTQQRIYEEITVASALLDEPFTAFNEIDRVLDAVYWHKRPGYIELPRDMVGIEGSVHQRPSTGGHHSDSETLEAALSNAIAFINQSENPVILAGAELHRFGFRDKLLRLAEEKQIPVVTTLLGKSVMPEAHPLYLGIYGGAMGRTEITTLVETSDCLIILGAFMTDVNLGIYTANLARSRCVYATSDKITVCYSTYEDVTFEDFLDGLCSPQLAKRPEVNLEWVLEVAEPFVMVPDQTLTVKRLFQHLNQFLHDELTVIPDVGDCLWGSADLRLPEHTEFISQAYYTSMGFAIPAAVGAQLGKPGSRPLVIVGDGAFQMTGTELSTTIRYGLNPIILVLNNHGYGTMRPLVEGPFNDIINWRYTHLPEMLGAGRAFAVRTEGEFDSAMKAALSETQHFVMIEAELEKSDMSPALIRLAEKVSEQV
ncbi:alpha-keto acid decarboxylase family protein [Candidatus Poribacteria bacterium]|nr:alpha-keto acid decarboxylase family protein [Candidatus Poribacteria bacterium]